MTLNLQIRHYSLLCTSSSARLCSPPSPVSGIEFIEFAKLCKCYINFSQFTIRRSFIKPRTHFMRICCFIHTIIFSLMIDPPKFATIKAQDHAGGALNRQVHKYTKYIKRNPPLAALIKAHTVIQSSSSSTVRKDCLWRPSVHSDHHLKAVQCRSIPARPSSL